MKITLLLFLTIVFVYSCKTNNATKLYPKSTECDTTNRSYVNHISPILKSNCGGCHTNGGNSGTVKLDAYIDVVDAINNKNLLKSINHINTSSKNMPPSGKMNDCNIKTIQAWVNQGSKNN